MGVFGTYSGKMDIPVEKRKIFSRQMKKLLNYGGMMEFEQVSIYEQEILLLKPVDLLQEEKVLFHYNYFEEDAWECAGFDVDTCRLWSGKIGSAEFADVMMAGYYLYEQYSEEPGLADLNGDFINSTIYAGWLNQILGTEFSMKNRFRLWENAESIALPQTSDERVEGFSEKNLREIIPYGMMQAAGGTELTDLLYLINGTKSLDDATDIEEGTYPSDVLKCKKAVRTYLDDGNGSLDRLWDFLKLDYEARKAGTEEVFRPIAELSLSMPARVFVYLALENSDDPGKSTFWEIWEQLKDQVYRDEIGKPYASRELVEYRENKRCARIGKVSTSYFLRQDSYFTFWDTPDEIKGKPNYYLSDDDRLYWWDGSDEVEMSADTEQWLKELAKRHKEIVKNLTDEELQRVDFFEYFLKTILEINDFYKRIFPFQKMFYEFLQNGKSKSYFAAVMLFKELADSDEYKTDGAIIKYVKRNWDMTSKNVTHNPARLKLKRYLSVMANGKLRNIYFGF